MDIENLSESQKLSTWLCLGPDHLLPLLSVCLRGDGERQASRADSQKCLLGSWITTCGTMRLPQRLWLIKPSSDLILAWERNLPACLTRRPGPMKKCNWSLFHHDLTRKRNPNNDARRHTASSLLSKKSHRPPIAWRESSTILPTPVPHRRAGEASGPGYYLAPG